VTAPSTLKVGDALIPLLPDRKKKKRKKKKRGGGRTLIPDHRRGEGKRGKKYVMSQKSICPLTTEREVEKGGKNKENGKPTPNRKGKPQTLLLYCVDKGRERGEKEREKKKKRRRSFVSPRKFTTPDLEERGKEEEEKKGRKGATCREKQLILIAPNWGGEKEKKEKKKKGDGRLHGRTPNHGYKKYYHLSYNQGLIARKKKGEERKEKKKEKEE